MAADAVLRKGVQTATALLDRFGILAAPARGLLDARRVITIDRDAEQVRALLVDAGRAAMLFGGSATLEGAGSADGSAIRWRLGTRGDASATVGRTREGRTEVLLDVHLEKVTTGGRPRYVDNAGVVALRAAPGEEPPRGRRDGDAGQ